MAEVYKTRGGGYAVKLPGNRWQEVSEAQAAQIVNEGSAEAFGRQALETAAALPAGAAALAGNEGARDYLARSAERGETRAIANPTASMAGTVAGYLPDLAAGGLAGAGARTIGRQVLRGASVEAGLGAARNPDAPISGALVQGVAGAGGVPAGMAAGALTRRFSRSAERVVEISRARRGEGALARGPERGAPGSIYGDTAAAGQAGNQGFLSRMWGDMTGEVDQAFVDAATSKGFRLTPSMVRDSDALRNVEASLEAKPGGAAALAPIREQNQTALNRNIAASIGQEADAITPDVLGRAEAEIGTVFNKAAAQAGDVNLQGVGRQIDRIAGQLDDPVNRARLEGFAERVSARNMSGRELYAKISQWKRQADSWLSSQTGDREMGRALNDMAEVLEDRFFQAVPAETESALRVARERWRMLRTIEKSNVVNTDGDVSALKLNNTLQRKYLQEYKRGGGSDLPEIENALETAQLAYRMRDQIGNSGTATRSSNLLEMVTTAPLERAFGEAYLSGGDLLNRSARPRRFEAQ